MCLAPNSALDGDMLTVAVASSMYGLMQEIATGFEQQHGVKVRLIPGSTGKLYTQIVQGAPFDVFMAADNARPERLEREGHIVAGTRITYATGQLSLWSRVKKFPDLQALTSDDVRHIVIANPEAAPYGQAAREALEHAGIWQQVKDKLVYAQNEMQAAMMVAKGLADVGMVAAGSVKGGHALVIDSSLYAPIVHQAVALRDAPVVRAWMARIGSDRALLVMQWRR